MPRRPNRPATNPAAESAPGGFTRRKWWFSRAGDRAVRRAASATSVATVLPGFGMEELEPRTMLTTLTSTPATGPLNFAYYDGSNAIQINYNDVTFEALAAFVDTNNNVTITDLIPAGLPEPSVGADLYKIYVTSSHSDSYISIATVDLATGLLQDLSTAPPGFNATDVTGNPYITASPPDAGSVFLGAIDLNDNPVPQVQLTTSAGLQPAPASGFLTPGIEVIPKDPATGLQNDFGNFLVGGTVTGTVLFGGNVNEFYAGELLTGSIGGGAPAAAATSAIDNTPNFTVAGDLRELVTDGPVGTDGVLQTGTAENQALYVTNFYMTVGGTLGEVHIGNTTVGADTAANFAGTIQVNHSKFVSGQSAYPTATVDPVIGFRTDQTEVETIPGDGNPSDAMAGGQVDLRNDGTANPQILGSIPVLNGASGLPETNADGNIIYQASVDGVVQNNEGDASDTYGVGMLAGQTFTVTLSTTALDYDVIDPDGRVIASGSRAGTTAQQITTDRPGIYLFEVLNVNGGDTAYNLKITNIGDMGIGGIWIAGTYNDTGFDSGILCSNGSVGAINVTGVYLSTDAGPTPSADPSVPLNAPSSISIPAGNLNAVVAGQIGEINPNNANLLIDGPYLNVPFGNIGLLGTTTGVLDAHSQFDPNYLTAATPTFVTDDSEATAIGGSIQKINSVSTLECEIATNGGIGTIAAAGMGTDSPSYFDVNADNTGNDGIIDLVDVPGSFGDQNGGGPQFVTNSGGQIRYMVLGGPIFKDSAFGIGQVEPVSYAPGQVVTMTDQAGQTLTLTPIGDSLTNTITTTTSINTASGNNSSTSSTTTTSGPQITITSYPVRDKGGEVPVSITSNGGLQISASGTNGTATAIDIGSITFGGAVSEGFADVSSGISDRYGNVGIIQPSATSTTVSTTTTTATATSTVTTATTGTMSNALNLLLTGTAAINVLSIVTAGDATEISNTTRGEIASINANEVGDLVVHGNLGYTTPVATPAAVLPTTVITGGNTYPFVLQHTGVVINADAVAIQAYGAVGNVEVGGTIGSLIANYAISTGVKGSYATPGQIDGIVGPVVATNMLVVDIGQGLLPTGTGTVGLSGLFAAGKIGSVNNAGNPGGDIRGNIISEDVGPQNGVGIDSVSLVNASIVGSVIAILNSATSTFADTGDLGAGFNPVDNNESIFRNPFVYDIGSVAVSGSGGIIGASVRATNVGPVVVANGGFGILDSNIQSFDLGTIASVSASGYGIRGSQIGDGGYVGPVTATGFGTLESVLAFPLSVRPSDSTTPDFDPFTGLNPFNDGNAARVFDLNASLGTSITTPVIANVTDTGVLEDDTINGQENFAGLTAYRVRTALPIDDNPQALPTPNQPNIPVVGTVFSMSATFGGTIGHVNVYNTIDGLQLTAGHIVSFAPHNNVNRLGISVAGTIGSLVIHGNLGELYQNPSTLVYEPDSYVDTTGPSGTIGRMTIYGSLFANVRATGTIQSLTVLGDVSGSITADGQTNKLAIGTLRISGGLRDGSLTINGSAGSIVINGGLGSPTGALDIAGNVNLLSVGADHHRTGSSLQLALNVSGYVKTFSVYGTITGSVTVAGNVNSFTVTGDGTASDIVTGKVSIGGTLGSARIINGSVASSIVANGYINSFLISKGNLDTTALVESQIDSIRSFRITGGTGYGLYGSVLAPSGNNQSLNVSGNFGNGVSPATYNASSGTLFKVGGSVQTGSVVNYTFYLDTLQITGGVSTGATIIANPIKKQIIGGTVSGTVTSG